MRQYDVPRVNRAWIGESDAYHRRDEQADTAGWYGDVDDVEDRCTCGSGLAVIANTDFCECCIPVRFPR